jgi:phosphatidylglycerophosphate synthase
MEPKEAAMDNADFQQAKRAQLSILSKLEKRCLVWMAERMPPRVNSDHLTVLGVVGMFLAGLSYWYARSSRLGLLLVILFLAVNWFGDSLDGTLARVRNRQRPRYGFYVDHMTDTFAALFLTSGLALSGYMNTAIAAGLLLTFYMLSVEVYLATYTMGTFYLSFWIFGPTELRLLLAIGNLVLYFRNSPTIVLILIGREYRLFDVGGAVGIVGMALTLIIATTRHTRMLYRAEGLP